MGAPCPMAGITDQPRHASPLSSCSPLSHCPPSPHPGPSPERATTLSQSHCRLTLSAPPAKDHQDTPGVRVTFIICRGSRGQGHGEPAHPRRRVLGEPGGGVRAGECGEGQGSRSLSGETVRETDSKISR